MPANPIYLDHAATTPLLPRALEAMREGWSAWANPSSPHAAGRAARAALEQARARMKAALGWQGEVIFTSGASEALALGIGRAKAARLLVCDVEHDAALRAAGGAPRLPVGAHGVLDMDVLARQLAAGANALVVVQQVNSETGVVQDIGVIAELVRAHGGVLLCDAAQGAGKIGLPPADMVVLSAHKFGGPVGIGALLVRDYALLEPTGGQERGYRGGTEALPLVLGMVAAIEAGNAWMAQAGDLRARLERGLVGAGAQVIAGAAPDRIATIGAYRMPGKSSAAQLIRFDGAGIAVSAGSACSSGSLKPSHVLTAMGVEGHSEVIRVSIGRETTAADIDRFVTLWCEIRG